MMGWLGDLKAGSPDASFVQARLVENFDNLDKLLRSANVESATL